MRRTPGDGPDDAFCIEEGCMRPATHERPEGMMGDHEVVELVCETHDNTLIA